MNFIIFSSMNIDPQISSTIPKCKTPFSLSSQHTSEQVLIQEETALDENQLNDDHCFKCSKKGQLYCCDRCFRAFHKNCITTKRFSKVWTCQYCNSSKQCLSCQLPLGYEPQISLNQLIKTCTVCFRSIHKSCCRLPDELITKQQHFFSQMSSYVCNPCLKQFGFKLVLTFKRVLVENMERLYFFVNINTRSPIHAGWFQEAMLRDVPRCKDASLLKDVESYVIPKIDRIVRMKIPLNSKHEQFDDLINNLLVQGLPQATYGKSENYYFLVVWDGRDLTQATWQDQNVIRIHNKNNPESESLTKYLLYRKLQIHLKEKKNLESIYALFQKFLPLVTLNFEYQGFMQMYEHFKTNFICGSTFYCTQAENSGNKFQFMAKYLQEFYRRNLAQNPTIIICGSHLLKWQKRLKQVCNQINIVTMTGSESNIYEIKLKQILYQNIQTPRFHVLLIPFERWHKEKKQLTSKYFQFSTIIFDQIQPQNTEDSESFDKLLLKTQKILFFVDKLKNIQKLVERLNSRKIINLTDSIPNNFVYDFSSNRILNSELKEIIRTGNLKEQLHQLAQKIQEEPLIEQLQWNQLKRAAFLKYVLAFGMDYSPHEQLDKLVKLYPGQFVKSKNQLKNMYNYSQKFLAILYSHNNGGFANEKVNHYLFGLKASAVFKRICDLSRLRQLVEKHKNNPCKFPFFKPMKVFIGISIYEADLWKSQFDYLLSAIILEKGYGRLIQICQFRDWAKWASSCHYGSLKNWKDIPNSIFGDFVKHVILESNTRQLIKVVKIEQILKERGQYLFSMMDDDN